MEQNAVIQIHRDVILTSINKHFVHNERHAENFLLWIYSVGTQVFNKNKGQDQELSSHQIAIKAITFLDSTHNPERHWMTFLVHVLIDRRQTDERCLSSFDHAQPVQTDQEDPQRDPAALGRKCRVHLKHGRYDNHGTKY